MSELGINPLYDDIFNENIINTDINSNTIITNNLVVGTLSSIIPNTNIISNSNIQAPLFIGDLQGNATTSTNSTYATSSGTSNYVTSSGTSNYSNTSGSSNTSNYAITSGLTVDFTGSLNGIVTGTQSATTIPNGNITNAMLTGSIDNSKLLTLTTSSLVANSSTTAINSNSLNTIVLRDFNGNIITENILLQKLNAYYNLSLLSRNLVEYLFVDFPALKNSIHLSYNFAYLNSITLTILNLGGATSRITYSYSYISLCAEM